MERFFTQDIKNGKERCSWGAYAIFDSQLLKGHSLNITKSAN